MRIAPLLLLLLMFMTLPLSRISAALSDEQRTLFFGHDQRQAITDPAVMLRFAADHQRWLYQTSAIETLVAVSLGKRLKPSGDG